MLAVKQSVQMADFLLADYEANAQRLLSAETTGNDDVSVLRGQCERLYANVWEQLDEAAGKTAAAGRSVTTYRAIRTNPNVRVFGAVDGFSARVTNIEHRRNVDIVTTETTLHDNRVGLAYARQAIAALEAAWPDIDWTPAADEPDVDLRPRGLGGLLGRLFGRR
jgi:hypothetical protein